MPFSGKSSPGTPSSPPVANAAPFDLQLILSPADLDYLRALPALRLGVDPDWAPFASVDSSGRPDGMSAAYLRYVEQSLHIRFKVVPTASWRDTVEKADAGQIDFIAATTQNNQIKQPFFLSNAYTSYPVVIVTRQDSPFVGGLRDLLDKPVATVDAGDITGPELTLFAEMRRLPVSSANEGLDKVASGGAAAYVGSLSVVQPLIKRLHGGQLRVAAPTGYSEELRFGIAPDLERLVPLVNRVLTSIPRTERSRIQDAWVTTRLEYGVSSHTLWKILSPVAFIILGFIVILGIIIWHLRREVRQRRWTEKELQFQTRFLQLLMNTIPVPVFVKDAEGRYVAINRAYEEAMEVNAVDLMATDADLTSTTKTSDQGYLSRLASEVIQTGIPAHGELKYQTRDGEPCEAFYWLRMCPSEDGTPRAVVGALVNISLLRQMEQRELALKRQLIDLTQALPAVTFQIEYRKHTGFELLFVNEYTETFFGVTPQTLLAEAGAVRRMLGPHILLRLVKALLRSKANGHSADVEFPFERSRGDILWAHFEALPQRRRGDSVVWSGYLVDVTMSKRQSVALALAKFEAEEASTTKDVFLATMSHEIRTPMSGVVGLLELMNDCQLSVEAQHLLDMGREAAQALMRILNDILDFSKSHSGAIEIAQEPLDLRELLDRVAGIFTPDLHRKGLAFDVIVRSNVALKHLGDKYRLGQVLLNLVGNAAKFTEVGAIRVIVDVLSEDTASQVIRLVVHDSGIGISEAQRERIFLPFTQAASDTSRRYGGTGLGLAISKRLIEAMEGTIEIGAQRAQGTDVVISLTLRRDPRVPKRPPHKEAWVALGEDMATEALVEALQSLNVWPITAPLPTGRGDEPLLVFRQTQLTLPATERPVTLIDVSRDMLPHGLERSHEGYRLGTNPLRWEAIREVCRAADENLLDRVVIETLAAGGHSPKPAREALARTPMDENFRILIVEDQPLNQELLYRQLASLTACVCDLAENGNEALEAIARGRYHIVITDCAMPVMGGVELIIKIRIGEQLLEQPTYIVALTANVTDHQRELCLAAGVNEVLLKPVDIEQLRSLLQRAMEARQSSGLLESKAFIGIAQADMPALMSKLKASLGDDVAALARALGDLNRIAAKESAHRILGTARWFKLDDIATAAEALEATIDQRKPYEDETRLLMATVDLLLK
jgi:signal transduction histidine kinase/ABC-type amino acid transport substrate-binding protein/DNA-binding response OmpR family regulator